MPFSTWLKSTPRILPDKVLVRYNQAHIINRLWPSFSRWEILCMKPWLHWRHRLHFGHDFISSAPTRHWRPELTSPGMRYADSPACRAPITLLAFVDFILTKFYKFMFKNEQICLKLIIKRWAVRTYFPRTKPNLILYLAFFLSTQRAVMRYSYTHIFPCSLNQWHIVEIQNHK